MFENKETPDNHQLPIETWEEAKDFFITTLRFSHYSYNTEKAYRELVGRFLLYTELKFPLEENPEHGKRLLTHLKELHNKNIFVALVSDFNYLR